MSKNSLANKKRKKIKFDATSGSISGYLRSSESMETNDCSDNSMDTNKSDVTVQSSVGKDRFSVSGEFDDSFDLFVSKKVTGKTDASSVNSIVSHPRETSSASSFNKSNSPAKKGPVGKSSPAKSPAKKPTSRRARTVKSEYFNATDSQSIPCPFCFKFETDISTHFKLHCVYRSIINSETSSTLIQLHSDYWNSRRELGIPDVTPNETEVFKTDASSTLSKLLDVEEVKSDYKVPILKWNSKSRKSKYLLLRQSEHNREVVVTQKLAIVLMGSEQSEKDLNSDSLYRTVDGSVVSTTLLPLYSQTPMLWKKSILSLKELKEKEYYVKSMLPYFVSSSERINTQPVPTMKEEMDMPDMFAPVNDSPIKCDTNHSENAELQDNGISGPKESGLTECCAGEKSTMKDSCFSDTPTPIVSNSGDNSFVWERGGKRLSLDWEDLFDNPDFSDVIFLFSDGNFPGHSLVFWVRSKNIFHSISSGSSADSVKLLDWKDVSSVVGKAFIKYFYCGKTNHFKNMCLEELRIIEKLCETYREVDLKNFISDIASEKISPSKQSLQDDSEEMEILNRSVISSDKSVMNRNLTSPDIFDEFQCSQRTLVNDRLENCEEIVNLLSSSKRKLETCEEKQDSEENDKKRLKKELFRDKNEEEGTHRLTNHQKQDDAESVASVGAYSLSSGATMSPGRYAEMVKRPLSQCSTLPPPCESPIDMVEDNHGSPPMFNSSPPGCVQNNGNLSDVETEKVADHVQEHDEPGSPNDSFYFDNEQFNYSCFNDYFSPADSPPRSSILKKQASKSPSHSSTFDQQASKLVSHSSTCDQQVSKSIRNQGISKSPTDSTFRVLGTSASPPCSTFHDRGILASSSCSPFYDGGISKSPIHSSFRDRGISKTPTRSSFHDQGILKSPSRSSFPDYRISPSPPSPPTGGQHILKENKPAKNSLDKYFDDSIPLEFFNSTDVGKSPGPMAGSVAVSPICQSTPTQPASRPANSLLTPSPQIIVSDIVTPKLDYSNALTPDLKGELQKYGLKQNMDRKKAKTLLKFIYDSIHPVVPDNKKGKEDPKTTMSTRVGDTDTAIGGNSCDGVDDGSNSCSQNGHADPAGQSSISDNDEREGDGVYYDYEYTDEGTCSQEPSSYQTKDQLLGSVSKFIQGDAALFDSIVRYVPIWLSKFHQALRQADIKCTKNDLMDVLDQLCVTFRTERKISEKQATKKSKTKS